MDMAGIEQQVRQFVLDNFIFGNDDSLDTNTSFMENGIIDSLGILTLIMFTEEHYGIEVADEEVIPENFDSIHRLSSYILQKRYQAVAA